MEEKKKCDDCGCHWFESDVSALRQRCDRMEKALEFIRDDISEHFNEVELTMDETLIKTWRDRAVAALAPSEKGNTENQ